MESVLDIRTVFAVVSVCCVPVSHVDSLQNRTSRNVEIYENFFSSALRGQPADLPNEKGNFFLSPLHGIIPAIFQNAKNGRKKTGNLFLISCLGVPLYVAAVIRFSVCYNSTNWNFLSEIIIMPRYECGQLMILFKIFKGFHHLFCG